MIEFRAHHFLCALSYRGRGYSEEFVKNFTKLMDEMTDETLISVVEQTDSICSPCPHRRERLCEKQVKIEGLDRRHGEILAIKAGETHSWGEAKNRIRERMTIEDFHRVCKGCEWKSLGVCEQALREHLDHSHCSGSDSTSSV